MRLLSNDAGIANPSTNNKVLKNFDFFYCIKDQTKVPFTSEIFTDNIVLRIIKIILIINVKLSFDNIFGLPIFDIVSNPLIY